jgi:hypothetical protein
MRYGAVSIVAREQADLDPCDPWGTHLKGVLPKYFSRKGRARPSSLRSRSGCYGGVGPGAPYVFPVLCGGVGDPALPRNRLSRFGQHTLKIRPQCLRQSRSTEEEDEDTRERNA